MTADPLRLITASDWQRAIKAGRARRSTFKQSLAKLISDKRPTNEPRR